MAARDCCRGGLLAPAWSSVKPAEPGPPANERFGAGLWEENADWWIAGFTDGADPEYRDQIVPLACELLAGAAHVLDLGCGEGQIARALSTRGARVVGVDPTLAQLDVARTRNAAPIGGARVAAFAAGRADAIPLASTSVDAVLACLVFEHVEDLAGGLEEVFRVLRPGGLFVWMLNHPLLQCPGSGWIIDVDLDERYWRVGPYLQQRHVVEEVTKDVFIPFVHRPLGESINTLLAAGFQMELMLEPRPPESYLQQAPELAEQGDIPRLLVLAARRTAAPVSLPVAHTFSPSAPVAGPGES